jgi:sulfotransferase family protein
MPDFIIVGAAKAATSSLHHYLQQHTSIQMSRDRWTRFFHIDAGIPDFDVLEQIYGSALRAESERRFKFMCHSEIPHTFEEYCQQWPVQAEGKILGESSPTYLYDPKVAERIKARFPKVKLIVVLRQPADRAYSHFNMDLKRGWISDGSFVESLNREPITANNFWWGTRQYFRQGIYAPRISHLFKLFDREQIKIMLYDEILTQPKLFLEELFQFIGVDTDCNIDTSVHHNEGLFEKTSEGNTSSFKPPPINPDLRRSLTETYWSDIRQVEMLTDKDLSSWLDM